MVIEDAIKTTVKDTVNDGRSEGAPVITDEHGSYGGLTNRISANHKRREVGNLYAFGRISSREWDRVVLGNPETCVL